MVTNKIHLVAILFLILGIILNLLPLTSMLNSYKPPILLLILIYWSLAFPGHINLTYAFILGLIMDILLIMPLGYNALCFTITIYLILLYYPQIRLQSNWNKMISLLIILIPYFLMSTIVNGMLKIEYNIINVIVSIIISILIWPGLFSMLRFVRQKYIS
ncbi:MAG: rod shape-determining protein MreD [Gammaproteobacteria bacterium]|tara:strand:+ start:875 stop:1354 length:480 start_codon:yes stop_codon:yes gene_type:complete